MVNWVKDFHRIRKETKPEGIEYRSTVKENINTSRVWAAIHNNNADD